MRAWPVMLFVAALVASCSTDAKGSEVLVSRELRPNGLIASCDDLGLASGPRSQRCTARSSGRTFRNADGDVAVTGDARASFHLEGSDEQQIVCGSEVYVRAFTSHATDFVVEAAGSLTFEDGSAVQLIPDHAISVGNALCFEEVGRWEGTAGSYLGLSGDYLLVEDRLQATLTLSER